MTPPAGLRERKKQALRAALSQTAWSLMLEQGIDAVSPESVAAAVGVSARTFRNYFDSREEAIVEAVVHQAVSLPDALRARPAGESAWDTLIQVLPDAIAAILGSREDVATLVRTSQHTRTLQAEHLATHERIRRDLTEAIAERTGTDADRDLTPRLLACAAGAALETSIEVWALGDGRTSLPDLIRESLAQLRAGIPLGERAIPTA